MKINVCNILYCIMCLNSFLPNLFNLLKTKQALSVKMSCYFFLEKKGDNLLKSILKYVKLEHCN